MKYIVEMGSFVTILRHRKVVVYAKSESEAIKKAKAKYTSLQMNNQNVIDAGSVEVDSIVAEEKHE